MLHSSNLKQSTLPFIKIPRRQSLQKMQTEEIIGTTVTNIYTLVKMEVGGLDTAECFVELDNKTIIDIPFGFLRTFEDLKHP